MDTTTADAPFGASLVVVHWGLAVPLADGLAVSLFYVFQIVGYRRGHLRTLKGASHMAQEYWLKREGKTYGPYSGGKLKKLAAAGRIRDDDQISTDKQSWQLAVTVRGLFPTETRLPQTASVAGTTSGSHQPQRSAPEFEPWFLPGVPHSVRVAIVIAGVIVAGLIVTAPIWMQALSEEPETSGHLARSGENTQGGSRSLESSDGTKAYYDRGVASAERGQYADALAAFKKAVTIKPDHAHAYSNMGFVYCHLGRYADSIAACKKAVAFDPDCSRAYSIMGIAHSYLGQATDAVTACRKSIAIKPDSPDAYAGMGLAYNNLGQYNDALAACRKAIAIAPDHAEAYFNMGNAYGSLKQYADSIAALKQAVAIKPDYAQAYYLMGCACGSLKQYADALAAFKKTVSIKPNHAEAHAHIGFTHEVLKQYPDALAAYKKAIALDPTGKFASLTREAIRKLAEKETTKAGIAVAWSEIQQKGQGAAFKAFVADVDNILMVNDRAMYGGADRYLIRKMSAPVPAVGGDIEAKCRALKAQVASTSSKVDAWQNAAIMTGIAEARARHERGLVTGFRDDLGHKATWMRLTRVIKADLAKITKMRDDLKAIIPR